MERIAKKDLESFNVHDFSNILSISLWVLGYISDDSVDRFGVTEIAEYIINQLGISTSRQAVHAALTKATKQKLCHKDRVGFKLMKLGQDELFRQMRKERTTLLEPGKPFSAGLELGNIFSRLEGVVRINDPYIDGKTLDVVHKYLSGREAIIKILTSQINNERSFKHDLKKIQDEGIDIEVRKISRGVLHDRYFIDDKNFWLSGNSLNNLGKKESFIVRLGFGLRQTMLQTFNSRWQSGIQV